MKPETPYVETEAVLAVMNEDDDRLDELLGDMLPGELSEFSQQVYQLTVAIDTERHNRRTAERNATEGGGRGER